MGNALSRVGFAVAAILSVGTVEKAQQPTAPLTYTNCGSEKGTHPCDWPTFLRHFTAAREVVAFTFPVQSASLASLEKMLREQGKVVGSSPSLKTELLIGVIQAPSTGISIGPADQPLGQLVVMAHNPSQEGSNGDVLWVETFYGQPDRPWPSVVEALVDQFQSRLKKNQH